MFGGSHKRLFVPSNTPNLADLIEIVSEVTLLHSNLAATQRYLGEVSEPNALRWIESLYGGRVRTASPESRSIQLFEVNSPRLAVNGTPFPVSLSER